MSRTSNVQSIAVIGLVGVLAIVAVQHAAAESGDYSNGGGSSYYSPMGSYSAPYGFSSTAFEGAQRGRAALVDAWGNFAVRSSQSAILWQQARALNRENDLEQTYALQVRRELWRQAKDSERKAREARDAEGKAKFTIVRDTVYKRAYALSELELNLNTGTICWPEALQAAKYDRERQRIDELYRTLVTYADPQPQLVYEIERLVDALVRALRSEAGNLPRNEYLAAHKFLRGLKYSAG